MNYRQNGTPSIQFSMSKDGRHADIDVDYRSSRIPQGLFNGHLTAANSDVRAGNNTQVHLQRWQGLMDWWRSLFGLPSATTIQMRKSVGRCAPSSAQGRRQGRRCSTGFSAGVAGGRQAGSCGVVFLDEIVFVLGGVWGELGKIVNAGNAPYVAAKNLGNISKSIGRVRATDHAVQPESLTGSDIKPMKQAYMTTFVLPGDEPNRVGLRVRSGCGV